MAMVFKVTTLRHTISKIGSWTRVTKISCRLDRQEGGGGRGRKGGYIVSLKYPRTWMKQYLKPKIVNQLKTPKDKEEKGWLTNTENCVTLGDGAQPV